MSSASQKEAHELAVFHEFALAVSLPIDAGTVHSRPPPEPDICCRLGGRTIYFELGRLLDPEMQRAHVWALRNAPKQVSLADYAVGVPERDVLRTKLCSSYETFGAPMESILYYDAENVLVAGGIPPLDFNHHAQCVMLPELSRMTAPMSRVWVYERYRKTVMWAHPPQGDA